MAGGGKTWLDACTLPCGSIRGIPVRVHREFLEKRKEAGEKEKNKRRLNDDGKNQTCSPPSFISFFLLSLSQLSLSLFNSTTLSPSTTIFSQADAAALERLYDSMALETETLGLDSGAIRSLWSFYRSVKEEEDAAAAGEEEGKGAAVAGSRKRRQRTSKPSAKRYCEFSPPLAPAAIRLLLFFLDGEDSDSDPGVALLRAAGDAAVGAALAELEHGLLVLARGDGRGGGRGREVVADEALQLRVVVDGGIHSRQLSRR